MENIEIKVGRIDELQEELQKKIIEAYHDINVDWDWYTYHIEEAKENLRIEGYYDLEYSFSGFGSQGDGGSFTGKVDVFKWLKYHNIHRYDDLLDSAGEDVAYIGRIYRHYSRYSHRNTIQLEIQSDLYGGEPNYYDILEAIDVLEEIILSDMKSKGDELYRILEEEYFDLVSYEAIKGTLLANDYYFDQHGKIWNI